jgi:hypothetical protein
MAEARVPNPLIEQFRRGGVARDLRLLAAQGALPLIPADLVELVHLLLADADQGVRATASATLAAMPAEELLSIARDRDTPGPVLGYLLAARGEARLRELTLQNTSTPDEAIEAEAARLPEGLAELVVINQVRLLRRPSLLGALEANPSLNRDQARRLRELREEFRIGLPDEAPSPAKAPPPPPAAPPVAPPPAVEVPEEPEEPGPQSEQEAVAALLTPEEQADQEKLSTVQRLYKLNTAQKLIRALKGNREERAILIRERNRLVSMAVLGSPRITESEIESFAGLKNVSDEILRAIGNHREWTKKYSVVTTLVRNPRTPVGVAIGLVSRLNPRDLKGLAVDRNVSEVVRKAAQRFSKPAQGAGGGGKH